MMCCDVEVSLNAWLDGELDASGAAAMDEHLRACDPCRRRFETLKTARAIVRTLAPAESPAAGAARPQRYYAAVIALAMCVTMLLLMARSADRPAVTLLPEPLVPGLDCNVRDPGPTCEVVVPPAPCSSAPECSALTP